MNKVLIVDDETEIAESLGICLDKYGYQSTIAGSALGALRALKSSHYTAVILDVRLSGGISGIELAWRIRRRDQNIQIIVFSAIHHGPEMEKQMSALEATFFVKPVTIESIIDLLRGGGA